ncbi:MAG: hypothetical protein ACD_84C00027G0002 [uncultured bacterium]|nr:MAG: hypothetical protein ACD_84C00027G0002 [uncultured bacterium]
MFTSKRIGGMAPAPLDNLIGGIQQELNARGHSFVTKQIAAGAMSME